MSDTSRLFSNGFSLHPAALSGPMINPIQAGVFWNHIGHCASLRFSFIYFPITTKLGMIVKWHKISQKL